MRQAAEARDVGESGRRRAAVEMIARHEAALRRTARRYSIDAEDAEDAYQRALEIALTKAPTTSPGELIRWTQTVTKHEALAVRRSREKLLGRYPRHEGEDHDPVELAPARDDGPADRVERREEIARSREALQALKPAELTALSLLAEGYSYAEIGERTGFSQTKVNRLLAEGRARFRGLVARHEDGSRCRELAPLLSAFCDGEASPEQADVVREHLRACGGCRATMRAYRRAPRLAAALLPLAPSSPSLLGRLHDLAANLASRVPGIGGESPVAPAAAAGGAPAAGIAKLVVVCVGAAGGAAACVATGALPAPASLMEHSREPTVELEAARPDDANGAGAAYESTAEAPVAKEESPVEPKHPKGHGAGARPEREATAPEAGAPEASAESAGSIEYEAPPPASEPAPAATESAAAPTSGSAAGEFGP